MTKSAKGTIESPGTNVKAKSGLNREILKQGWGYFKTFLEYKCEWYGGELVLVPPHHTSQHCSQCGNTKGNERKGKVFKCSACNVEMDADDNASQNTEKRGWEKLAKHSQTDGWSGIACGEMDIGSLTMKEAGTSGAEKCPSQKPQSIQ